LIDSTETALITALEGHALRTREGPASFRGSCKSKHRRELINGTFYEWWLARVANAKKVPWFFRLDLAKKLLANSDERDAFITLLHIAKTDREVDEAVQTAIDW